MIDTKTDVHLWRCSLDLPSASLEDAHAVLSPDEIDRARRYRFTRDRQRFVAARSFLRRTLAEYLSIGPREISFVYEPFGKPRLSHDVMDEIVEFNLSHSGGLAVLAVTRGVAVGVDVEQVLHVSEWRGIASRFFSAYENATLSRAGLETRDVAFYRCWTRKEAFLKALGSGLAHSLDSFDVSLDESEPKLVSVRGDPAALSKWSLYDLCPLPGYVGALAIERHAVRLRWQSGGPPARWCPNRCAMADSLGAGGPGSLPRR